MAAGTAAAGTAPASTLAVVRGSYEVRTYGCQMNVHDSERIAGLLDADGWVPAADGAEADLVVFNTCAVRENADNRLYGNLGHLAPREGQPRRMIAVGGCLAQKDRDRVVQRAPWVDVVFGTHNVHALPRLLERARVEAEAQVELAEALEVFPSSLPARRHSPYSAWVSISVGCDNTCTFCIVPSLRGRERDRSGGDVLAEVGALVADGVVEVTLLGQNVNSWGREAGEREGFARLLRATGTFAADGLERVRFTSPHPRDFTPDVVDAMAETPVVMPSLHLPLQSGSDAVLRRMRRSYRAERFGRIVDLVRDRLPDAALTTDVIVGFPGETEEDFAATLEVVERSRFASAFTFQYSPRPGTPAATLSDQVPPDVVRERYGRLVVLVDRLAQEQNDALVGRPLQVLLTDSPGRKGRTTARASGRARDGRLVHLPLPAGARPGDVVTTTVTAAAPHHLVADGPARVRRTSGGDAWERARGLPPARPSVALGLPGVGAPPAAAAGPACEAA